MKTIIHTDNAPKAIGPYSQAIEVNGTLYISGQLPVNPETGELISTNIKDATRQVLLNVGAILKQAGCTFQNVVKSTCLLKNLDDFKDMNEVYAEFYSETPPARAAFQVAKLPLDALIEIETIAVK